ncbi:MAG: LysM peptidoglycan-binding domain-containing protein [Treponema sp.]|jgi:hypothetical protein|nr:LysM peptidoglycan-binding domain-containing protein [Treponema sp.]
MAIGIKIANGEFYPIIEENSVQKKRITLSAAHKAQKNMRIYLYKTDCYSMDDAVLLGELAFDALHETPSIELFVSSDGKGGIKAVGQDKESGKTRIISVSLDVVGKDEVNEAEIAQISQVFVDFQTKKKFNVVPVVIGFAVVLATVACFLWWGRLSHVETSAVESATPTPPVTVVPTPMEASAVESATPTPPVTVVPTPVETSAVESATPTPPVTVVPTPVEASAVESAKKAPVRDYAVPSTIPRAGIRYKVKWMDTLWDIADVFYGDPWLYQRLARYNRLRNPNVVIPGTIIRVPQKSRLQ